MNLRRAQLADSRLQPAGEGDDRARVHRLRDHFDGPRPQGLQAQRRSRRRVRADDDDRNRLMLHQVPQEGQAVHFRHLDVQGDDIRAVLRDELTCAEGVGGLSNDLDVGLSSQSAGQHPSAGGRVVDDQHAGFSLGRHHQPFDGRTRILHGRSSTHSR